MSGRAIKLPTFAIAGAQKCGTTSLHHYLREHRAVFIPKSPQELHFFDLDENYKLGTDWYARHFAPAEDSHVAIGQTSPLYIYADKTAERMAALLAGTKLIFILRNPVDRAYSHYWHEVKNGRESLSFDKALDGETQRILEGPQARRVFSYADRGYYARQLARFLRFFGKDQILVVLTEDLQAKPGLVLDRCCAFLGIEKAGQQIITALADTKYNESSVPRFALVQRLVSPHRAKQKRVISIIDRLNLREFRYPPMKPEVREKLRAAFVKENRRLGEMFGLDLSAWERERTSGNPSVSEER